MQILSCAYPINFNFLNYTKKLFSGTEKRNPNFARETIYPTIAQHYHAEPSKNLPSSSTRLSKLISTLFSQKKKNLSSDSIQFPRGKGIAKQILKPGIAKRIGQAELIIYRRLTNSMHERTATGSGLAKCIIVS